MADSITVTIVTGLPGNGKTALLKRILAGTHGHRVAAAERIVGGL